MKLTGNTVLITGGGSGIGRALAETLHRAGNRVVIAGRRRGVLQAVAEANPGIEHRHLDLAQPDSIDRLATELTGSYPGLNVLVNNAGVMRTEDLSTGEAAPAEIAEQTVAVNLLGPIRLTAALLPTLLLQPDAAIANVTSALAFVPKRSCRLTQRRRRACTPTPSLFATNCGTLRSRSSRSSRRGSKPT